MKWKDMDLQVIEFARNNDLISGDIFDPVEILDLLEERERKGDRLKCPPFFMKALSHDGMQFTSLSEFPRWEMLRVCRDSKDHTFCVGDIVWRDRNLLPSKMDGINFWRDAACLDEEDCVESLVGAHFERTTWRFGRRKGP